MTTITVSGSYIIAANDTVTLAAPSIFAAYTLHGAAGADASFTDLGSLQIYSNEVDAEVVGVADDGISFAWRATFTVASGGSYSVTAPVSNMAVGYSSGLSIARVENDGAFTVAGGKFAYGAIFSNIVNQFVNTGAFEVTGTFATGVMAGFATTTATGTYSNAGAFRISGGVSAIGFDIDGTEGGSLLNSGSIIASASSSVATAIHLGTSYSGFVFEITNTGVISAPKAIVADNISVDFAHVQSHAAILGSPRVHLTNSGTIYGEIDLGVGPDAPRIAVGTVEGAQIHNSGTIYGPIHLTTNGNDLYDGAAGVHVGALYLGDGDDTVILGNQGEIVVAAAGNHTIAGGAGADTYVFDAASGHAVVNGFSVGHDRANLAGLHLFDNVSDMLASTTQVGGDSVISLGGGSLTLSNIQRSSLSSADFTFESPSADFDRNGISDVLLEDQATGQIGLWSLNSSAQATWVPVAFEGAGWRVTGLGDFDSNGVADILLENRTTGQVGLWLISDLQPAWKSVSMAGAGWHVAGVGDVNGDWTSDIVLENQATGQVGLWEMTIGAPTWAPVSTEGAGWHVAPIGDVNGDGTADIVLENPATGQVGVWTMSNNQPTWASIATEGAGWHVAAAGDVNGDGTADIVLENASTGMVGVWTMNNGHPTWVYISTEGPGWHVAALRDYSGDGRADFLLESSNGATGLWVMHADDTVSWKGLSEVGAGWHVV